MSERVSSFEGVEGVLDLRFRLLFIGDVVGEAGCAAVKALLPALREELEADAVVANGENSAPQGRGVTPESASSLLLSGVDFITLGNHAFDAEEGKGFIDQESRVARPANMDRDLPGKGYGVFEVGDVRLGVGNVQGRVFMREELPSPFEVVDRVVGELKEDNADIVLVDIHAEATSEKQAMGYYLAGRVEAVVGTHTHIPTADSKILSGRTAYITDVGMTGSSESIIGFNKEQFMDLFLGRRWAQIEPAREAPAELNGALIEIDVESRRAVGIEQIRRGGKN